MYSKNVGELYLNVLIPSQIQQVKKEKKKKKKGILTPTMSPLYSRHQILLTILGPMLSGLILPYLVFYFSFAHALYIPTSLFFTQVNSEVLGRKYSVRIRSFSFSSFSSPLSKPSLPSGV